MIPGSNLLNAAFSVIAQQQVTYLRYLSRELNEIGNYVTTYEAGVTLRGSLQAIPRTKYEQYGLDLQKNYVMFYASKNILDLARDISGDLIAFGGKLYQCQSESDWYGVDGWTSVQCVDIGNYDANANAFSDGFRWESFG